jgi:hypothetical protein
MMCLVVRGRARAGCEESFAERPWPKLLLAKEWRTLQQRLTADGKFEGKRDLKFRFSETSKVRAGLRYRETRHRPSLVALPAREEFRSSFTEGGTLNDEHSSRREPLPIFRCVDVDVSAGKWQFCNAITIGKNNPFSSGPLIQSD